MTDINSFREEIDNYLFGRLDKEGEEAFLREIATNKALAEALEHRKNLHAGMTEAGRQKLRSELDAAYNEVYGTEKKTPVKRMTPWRSLAAIAAVVLLGIVSWWLWPAPTQNVNPIFAEYYQPFNLILAQRGEADEAQLGEAAKLYRSKKYQAAIPAIEKALSNPSAKDQHAQLRLSLAIARFASGDTANAFSPLTEIIQSNDLFLSDLARWYTALFHLQLNQNTQAISYLQMLANKPGADKHAEAKEILARLK